MKGRLRRAWVALAVICPALGSASLLLADCPYTEVSLNTTINAALTTSDCPLGSGYADYYRFFAQQGTQITASLGGSLGTVVLSIHESETGPSLVKDSEFTTPSIALAAPVDAFYFLRIWSTDPEIKTGAYRLKLNGFKNANGCSVDPDPATLCVDSDRFKIQVAWQALHLGTQGNGTAISLSGDTGAFWFFSSSNLELMIKVLDGTGVNGHFWVFYGALTDVQYTITVTDTLTGAVKTYASAQDTQTSASDTGAF